jgi:hypothetical protein
VTSGLRTAVVATGVALAAALTLATKAGAQERVQWKMQSAFPGNLPHTGVAAKRVEAMVAAAARRMAAPNCSPTRMPVLHASRHRRLEAVVDHLLGGDLRHLFRGQRRFQPNIFDWNDPRWYRRAGHTKS